MAKEKEKEKRPRKAKKSASGDPGRSPRETSGTDATRARADSEAGAVKAKRSRVAAQAEDEAAADDDGAAAAVAEREAETDGALAVRSSDGSAIDAADDAAGAARVAADADVEAEEEEELPTQLGTERYVLAGFFTAAIIGAYVLGKFVHGVWSSLSNKDWFVQALPRLAAVSDDDKTTYGTIIGGVIALLLAIRTYRKPEVRTWSDEVASELAKVKWPTKKEVTNSTVVVIAASTIAVVYLMLLDRLWSFITNLVYGTGS